MNKRILAMINFVLLAISVLAFLLSFLLPKSGTLAMPGRISYFVGMFFLILSIMVMIMRILSKVDPIFKDKTMRYIAIGIGAVYILYAVGVFKYSVKTIAIDLSQGPKEYLVDEWNLSDDEKSLYTYIDGENNVFQLSGSHRDELKNKKGQSIHIIYYENNMILEKIK